MIDTERVEFPDGIKVYNFTVEGNHNYFIIAQVDDYGQTCILVHNAKWYHGTDSDSANDILENGLNKNHMTDMIDPNAAGFYVTDSKHMAESFADLKSNFKGGTVLEFDDKDIGHLLIGDGTKLNEAIIPFDAFDKVMPNMIKISK